MYGNSALLCLLLIFLLLEVVALWIIFEKANQPGWGAIIPIYNVVLLFRIGGQSGWWALALLVPVVNFFVQIWLWLEVANSFGRSWLFGLGLFFLQPIFVMILAFGGSEYQRDTPGDWRGDLPGDYGKQKVKI